MYLIQALTFDVGVIMVANRNDLFQARLIAEGIDFTIFVEFLLEMMI